MYVNFVSIEMICMEFTVCHCFELINTNENWRKIVALVGGTQNKEAQSEGRFSHRMDDRPKQFSEIARHIRCSIDF